MRHKEVDWLKRMFDWRCSFYFKDKTGYRHGHKYTTLTSLNNTYNNLTIQQTFVLVNRNKYTEKLFFSQINRIFLFCKSLSRAGSERQNHFFTMAPKMRATKKLEPWNFTNLLDYKQFITRKISSHFINLPPIYVTSFSNISYCINCE